MAITSYSELKSAVASWLNDSNLTSRIPEFISMAEDRIAHRLRIRSMEADASLTISSEDTALPSAFLEARRLYLTTDPKTTLEYVQPHHLAKIWASSQTGKPLVYTIEGTNLRVGPIPDQTYTGKLLYYAKLTAFSADTDTNWVLSNARGLYLYGALLEAAPFLGNDARIPVWEKQFEQILATVNKTEKEARFGGSPLVVRSGVFGV